MKKSITISIITGASLLLTGCGSIVSSSDNTLSSKSAATALEHTAVTTTAETPVETTQVVTEPVAAADIISPDDVVNEHKFVLSDGSGDTVTYADLYESGLANVSAEGTPFCLVPQGAAAGSRYSQLFISNDGGNTWEEKDVYQERNGIALSFAIEDGSLVTFTYQTPNCEAYPVAYSYRLSGDKLIRTEQNDVFNDVTLDDGSALDPNGSYDFSAVYEGGYQFHFVLEDKNTGAKMDKTGTLDPENLCLTSLHD